MLEWLEGTWIATFVRESPSIFAYTLVLSLHAMGLAIVVGINTAISLRLLGFARGIPVSPLLKLFPVMYVGFTINAISGFGLFAARATTLIGNTMFLLKIGFVALGVVSIELLRAKVFSHQELLIGGSMPPHTRTYAYISIACWGAALITGRLTAYPNFVVSFLGL
jgi:hypothetical protein